MDSMIVFVSSSVPLADLTSAIRSIDGLVLGSSTGGFDGLLEFSGDRRVYFRTDPDIALYFEPDELQRVAATVGDWRALLFDYSEIDAVKATVVAVARRWPCVVDDDHGGTYEGAEFLRRLAAEPAWDWRLS